MTEAKVVTFDFYGTLVQWHEAVRASFVEILRRHGKPASADPAPVIHDFHAEAAYCATRLLFVPIARSCGKACAER